MSTDISLPTGDQVVQDLPWRWRVQGKIFLIGGLGFMFDAWDVTLNAYLIPLLIGDWGLTTGQAAWIATSNLIGMAVGAFAWGSVADIIGRKRAFTLTLLVFSIFTVLGAFSPDIVWFCFFRFLAGFGLGGPSAPSSAEWSRRRSWRSSGTGGTRCWSWCCPRCWCSGCGAVFPNPPSTSSSAAGGKKPAR
jgi:MFS family permease